MAMDAVIVALAGLATAWNTRENGFVWDDRVAVIGNRDVNTNLSPWMGAFVNDFWGTPIDSAESHKSYRPLTILSFRWDYYWSGHDPQAYHMTNVVIHAVCSLLVWKTASLVLSKYEQSPSRWGSRLAGLVFAVHPIHCDSVASIVGRADLLCVVFALIGYLQYNAAETTSSTLHFAGAFFSVILASLCKELGFTVFGIYIFHEVLAAIAREGSLRNPDRRRRISSLIVGVLVLAMVRLRINGSHTQANFNSLANSINKEPSRLTRVLSYAHVHAWYLWKLVWPSWFSYDYGFNTIPVVTSIVDPRNLLTLVAYMVVLGGVFVGFHSAKRPTLLMCIAFGIIPFVPASNLFFPVGTIVAERLLYFPSVGFCLLVGYVADRFMDALDIQEKQAAASSTVLLDETILLAWTRRLSQLSVGLILFTGYWMSTGRNLDWRDERTLFLAALQVVPENVKVLNNVAMVLLNSEPERAVEAARVSIALLPTQIEGQTNLGLGYSNVENELVGLRHFMKSFAYAKTESTGAGYTGTILYERWRRENEGAPLEVWRRSPTIRMAIRFLDAAIERGTTQPIHFYKRGLIAHDMRDVTDALRYLQAAVAANNRLRHSKLDRELIVTPPSVKNFVAISLRELGRLEEALDTLREAIHEDPGHSQSYINAASISMQMGDNRAAELLIEQCLRACKHADDLRLGANMFERLGHGSVAAALHDRANALDRDAT